MGVDGFEDVVSQSEESKVMIGLKAGLGCGGRCRASLYSVALARTLAQTLAQAQAQTQTHAQGRLRVRVAPGSGKALQSPGKKKSNVVENARLMMKNSKMMRLRGRFSHEFFFFRPWLVERNLQTPKWHEYKILQ